MLKNLKRFWNEESGMGTVELVIIIGVLVAIALIFKDALINFVNELIDKAMATADAAERDAIMQEVWQIAYDDVAMMTTFFTCDVYAVNERVAYVPRADQMIYAWNFSFPA